MTVTESQAPAPVPEKDGTADPAATPCVLIPRNRRRLLPWMATLASAGIPYRVMTTEPLPELQVEAADAPAARRELAEYERVNANWPAQSAPPAAPAPRADVSLQVNLLAAVSLLLMYRISGPFAAEAPLFAAGAARSELILNGQWWRTLTALTLHADFPHVAGNAVCCALLGHGLSRALGVGVAWGLALGTGVAGNAAAAWLLGPGHSAVGASTVVFGMLGMLGVLQGAWHWRREGALRSVWQRSWLPLAAALGVLGLLGTGPQADLTGHAMGFAAGLVLGALAVPLSRYPLRPGWQAVAGAATVAALGLAWMQALAGN